MEPAGFRDDPAPAEAVAGIRRACVDEDGLDPLDEAADLLLRHQGLGDGVRLWIADADGFALLREGTLDLAVRPAARRRGLGGVLAETALGSGQVATAWSHGDHPGARRLAELHGLVRARELWVMRRLAAQPLPNLVLPPGVRIRSYLPGDDEAVLSVNAAAFAHHPEQGALDSAGLAARRAEPWFSPDGLLLAVDDEGRLLGFHWTKQHDAELGEVYVVAIAPDAQGRGLGRALTLAGLYHLAGLGVSEVLLYVESDNAPAVAVYSRLGFTHLPADTHVSYSVPSR